MTSYDKNPAVPAAGKLMHGYAALCKELRALYKTMIPQPYYRGNVIFYGN